MSPSKFFILGPFAAALALGGVADAAAKKPKIDPAAQKEADSVYATVCTTCHGPAGKGDGPTAMVLNPKPANFTDPAFHKARTDEQLDKVILNGGASVGRSSMMPPNPSLKDKPEVLKALVAKLRGFGTAKKK